MRLLLDECVNEQLRQHFPGHECLTARYAGFAGLENGELLEAAEAAKFDVLLTVDRGFEYQQNLAGRRIAVIVSAASPFFSKTYSHSCRPASTA
jgi:predicted nuclease of predicted toxin-antitoxin system